jgi:hypothetical protein
MQDDDGDLVRRDQKLETDIKADARGKRRVGSDPR